MLKRIVLSLLVVLALTACAPDQGTIKKKDYDDAYSYWQAGTTTCSGTPSRCTTSSGYYVYVPESFQLLIVNGDEKGWASVSERTYERAEIGGWYDNGEVRDTR